MVGFNKLQEDDVSKYDIIDFQRDNNAIKKWSHDAKLIKRVTSRHFKYLSYKDCMKVIKLFLKGDSLNSKVYFNRNDISKSKKMHHHNMGKFDDDGFIKPLIYEHIKKDIFKYISMREIKENKFITGLNEDNITDDNTYWIDKDLSFEVFRKLVCDEKTDYKIKHDFDKSKLKIQTIDKSDSDVQRFYIDILFERVSFSFHTDYVYVCDECGSRTNKKMYEITTKNKTHSCKNEILTENAKGEPRIKVCNNVMYPDYHLCETKDAFFYDLNYEDIDGKYSSIQGVSFTPLKPGKYEAVGFARSNSDGRGIIYMVDVKEPEPNVFLIPEKTDENYIFPLINTIDSFIKKQTGLEIYGMLPIKAALILQTMINILSEKLNYNCMIVGDPSTGKSLILKYYSAVLNNYNNITTNGISVSIPGLRGTRSNINLFGREIKIVTPGLLGTYRSIHIDEAGENRELVQHLKTFLLEDNYSYDKAGGTGTTNKRTAHINVSENLDYNHVGQYRGAIRKAYKDLMVTIEGENKEEWDESWDLYKPIHMYDNPYLRKIIREKRLEFQMKKIWWIDGHDFALHERFPFYFYLATEKEFIKLKNVQKENASRKILSEKLEITRALYTDVLENFFRSLSDYKEGNGDIDAFDDLDKILDAYNLHLDARTREMYYKLLTYSRILNKRKNFHKMDFELVEWFIENTNVKVDVADISTYKLIGPPSKNEIKNQESQEENAENNDIFSIPLDD